MAVSASAQANVTFQWDPYTALPGGFEMTLTPSMGTAIVKDCGQVTNNQCLVSAIPAGVFIASCRAYNIGIPIALKSYSDPSNTVSFTVPVKPPAPANTKIGIAQMTLNLSWPAGELLALDLIVRKE